MDDQRQELPVPVLESVEPDHVPLHVPTEVVIHGQNFIATITSLYLGERLLTCEVVSADEIRATVLCDTQGFTVIRVRIGYQDGNTVPLKIGSPVVGNPVSRKRRPENSLIAADGTDCNASNGKEDQEQ